MYATSTSSDLPCPQVTSPSQREEGQSTLCGKVNSFFQECLKILLLIGYAIGCAFYRGLTVHPWGWVKYRVFNFTGILCSSSNSARFGDLPRYVDYRWDPYQFSGEEKGRVEEIVDRHGFLSVNQKVFTPYPLGNGLCHGSVMVALKSWLQTGDETELIKVSEGGAPLYGAMLQAFYSSDLLAPLFYAPLKNSILTLLQNKELDASEIEALKNIEGAQEICAAVRAYLESGGDPNQGDLVEGVRKHLHKELKGPLLASVREAAQSYASVNLAEQDRMRAIFAIGGLKMKKFHHMWSAPKNVLASLPTLAQGAYYLSFPRYDKWGNQMGFHAAALIIAEEKCYLLDKNMALGFTSKNELQATLGRLFSYYNGYDYTSSLEGTPLPLWARIGNFFLELSNPPPDPLNAFYDLYEIGLDGNDEIDLTPV